MAWDGVVASLALLVLIGAILYASRRGRREYVLSLPCEDRQETWSFNVRDMRAELRRVASSRLLGSYELRRIAGSNWEIARIDEEAPESRIWFPCEASIVSELEGKYRRYNEAE